MTDMMMSLRALVEKSADADVLREMIGFAANQLRREMRDQHGVFEDLPQQHRAGVAGEVFGAGFDRKLRLKVIVKSDTVSPMAWLWARCG